MKKAYIKKSILLGTFIKMFFFTRGLYGANVLLSFALLFLSIKNVTAKPDISFFILLSWIKFLGYCISGFVYFNFYFQKRENFIKNTDLNLNVVYLSFLFIDTIIFILICITINHFI